VKAPRSGQHGRRAGLKGKTVNAELARILSAQPIRVLTTTDAALVRG